MKVAFLMVSFLTILLACKTTQTVTKSDSEYDKALAESKKNTSEKLDFLADEKLPNDEYVVKDSTRLVEPLSADYKEILPSQKAKFRVQVFAGSAVNGNKNYELLRKDSLLQNEVYLIHDTSDGKWRVWAGNYKTHEDAEKTKARLIASGFADAWIHEMKASWAPSAELFWVQVGSFKENAAAEKTRNAITGRTTIIKYTDNLYKVWVGGFEKRSEAEQLKKDLQNTGFPKTFIVQGAE